MEQNGQSVSAAGGIAASFLRRDSACGARNRLVKTRIAPSGAAIRQIQLPIANSESTGTAQKRAEALTKEDKAAHLK
jgi:hypothetical protein